MNLLLNCRDSSSPLAEPLRRQLGRLLRRLRQDQDVRHQGRRRQRRPRGGRLQARQLAPALRQGDYTWLGCPDLVCLLQQNAASRRQIKWLGRNTMQTSVGMAVRFGKSV